MGKIRTDEGPFFIILGGFGRAVSRAEVKMNRLPGSESSRPSDRMSLFLALCVHCRCLDFWER